MKVDISIIVPVYNASSFISKCIRSILNQKFRNFELLLINDGSTDNSLELCQEFAANDDRVKVFNRKNHGVSATREFGIQNAQGEYTLFVDSDDWIDENMLQDMFYAAKTNNADLVGSNFYEVYNDRKILNRTYYNTKEEFTRDVIKSHWGVVWKILVKKEIYVKNDIHFPININGGEDYVVCVKLLLNSEKVISVDKAFYFYNRCNQSSIMSTTTQKKVDEQIKATEIIEDYLTNLGLKLNYKFELDCRKFWSKFPLLKINPIKWKNIFPESNYIYRESKLNWKYKLYIKFLNII